MVHANEHRSGVRNPAENCGRIALYAALSAVVGGALYFVALALMSLR